MASILLLLPAAGCRTAGDASSAGGDELVMRTYRVPPGSSDELRGLISGLFQRGGEAPPLGSVRVPREGLLVVTAPASIHAGIEEIISSLGDVEWTPQPTIRITYWAVRGTRAAETAWPAELGPLAEALDAVTAADGPLDFALLEKIVLNSVSGNWSSTDGPYFGVEQRTTAKEGVIYADLHIRKGPVMDLRTSVRLEPGQLMVLEQAGFSSTIVDHPELAETSTYIVVQARVVSG